MDSIGDVVLTTPALSALRKKYPESFIAFLCRSYTAPILQGNLDLNMILKAEDYSWLELSQKIYELNFDAAIHFYVEPKTALATFCAGVPWRIGPFSKLWSLFLNHRIVQHRSKVEKHEAEYNLELVGHCGAEMEFIPPKIVLTEEEKKKGKEIIHSLGIHKEKAFVILHPGGKGSAQSWPLLLFLELAEKIANQLHLQVLFTAGEGEEEIVNAVKDKLGSKELPVHTLPAGTLNLRELASVIANSKLLVSNSTGPLHMAVALGVPTVSFYPKIPKVTSAKRWGPYGNSSLHTVFSPEDANQSLENVAPEKVLPTIKKLTKPE